VYKAAIKLIPHKHFTFAKIWLTFAHFELRRKDIAQARKIMGASIGMCPKEKLFKVRARRSVRGVADDPQGYVEMELQLCEFDRCRILYERYLHVRDSAFPDRGVRVTTARTV
jgi:crooked neck